MKPATATLELVMILLEKDDVTLRLQKDDGQTWVLQIVGDPDLLDEFDMPYVHGKYRLTLEKVVEPYVVGGGDAEGSAGDSASGDDRGGGVQEHPGASERNGLPRGPDGAS